jgi:sulfur-oxidizing protein SoxA
MIHFKNTTLLLFSSLLLIPAASAFASEVKSGYEYIQPASRAMQDDDFENPGLLTVDQGQRLFNIKQNGAGKACAECHELDGAGLNTRNIARYPVYAEDAAEIVTLQKMISRCRDDNTGSRTLPTNHPDLVALETFVRNRAIGEVVNVQTEGATSELLKRGEKLYRTRYGLIDMACYHCHEVYPGQMIRGQKISQGQGNGFPAYRLGTGEITNLHQRIQQCLVLMRAKPFDEESEELKLMELYIMSRSNGLRIETPAVRY